MRIRILLSLLVWMHISYVPFCHGQADNDILDNKGKLLKDYYELSYSENQDSSEIGMKLFFHEFPDSFTEFVSLYGYNESDSIKYGVLYYESYSHLNNLFKQLDTVVNMKSYYKKLIDLSTDGYWQADGVSHFQQMLKGKTKDRINLICELLSKLPDEQISGYWHFYFDGPSPEKSIPEELFQIKEIDNRMFLLMEKSLELVQSSWKSY